MGAGTTRSAGERAAGRRMQGVCASSFGGWRRGPGGGAQQRAGRQAGRQAGWLAAKQGTHGTRASLRPSSRYTGARYTPGISLCMARLRATDPSMVALAVARWTAVACAPGALLVRICNHGGGRGVGGSGAQEVSTDKVGEKQEPPVSHAALAVGQQVG